MKSYVFIAALTGLIVSHGQEGGVGAAAGAGGGAVGGTAAGAAGPVTGGAAGAGAPTTSRPGVIAAPSAPAPLTPGGINQAPGLTPPGPNGGTTITSPGIPDNRSFNTAAPNPANAAVPRAIPFNTLPAQVQNTFRSQGGATGFSAVTQIMTPQGPVFVARVDRAGGPQLIAVQPNGTVANLNTLRTADGQPVQNLLGNQNTFGNAGTPVGTGSAANSSGSGATSPTPPGTATLGGLSSAQAGLPVSSLPIPIQNALRTQVPGTTVQTVSRDDTAAGPLYRVTVLQGGVARELQFAANGTLLGAAPLDGSLTSAAGASPIVGTVPQPSVIVDENANPNAGAAPGAQTGGFQLQGQGQLQSTNPVIQTNLFLPRGDETNRTSRVNLEDLPEPVAEALREQAPYAEIRFISKDRRPSGEVYRIGLRVNENSRELLISEDGTIIRENRDRDPVVLGRSLEPERDRGLDFRRLPEAIRNTIQAYAGPEQIRSIILSRDREGKTVYEVVTYEDGRRNRLIVQKDGTLSKYDEDVSVAAEAPNSLPPILAIGDLPEEVQDTIRRQTDTVRIEEITSTTLDGDTVYQVRWQTNGSPVELMVGTDGAVIYPTGTILSEAAGENAPTPLPSEEEPAVVKTANPVHERTAKGAPAGAARGEATSNSLETQSRESSTSAELKQISLQEVPDRVRTRVGDVIGSGAVLEGITPRLESTGVVYEVTYTAQGEQRKLTLNQAGEVQNQED